MDPTEAFADEKCTKNYLQTVAFEDESQKRSFNRDERFMHTTSLILHTNYESFLIVLLPSVISMFYAFMMGVQSRIAATF